MTAPGFRHIAEVLEIHADLQRLLARAQEVQADCRSDEAQCLAGEIEGCAAEVGRMAQAEEQYLKDEPERTAEYLAECMWETDRNAA